MTAEKTPLLERLGTRYLQALGGAREEEHTATHVLDANERAELTAIARGAVTRAAAAGALSALVSAVAEMIADAVTEDVVRHWLILGAATGVASICEIAFLYWDALRSVHRLSRVARLNLFAGIGERAGVAGALARAALELPNPRTSPFGIDPLREASRARLLVASLLYKAKVSATNFLMKLVVRRLLGRAVVRAWLPLVALPVTAAWNGIVCWLVLREARLRAIGPSAARELADAIFEGAPPLSDEARVASIRAVASSIVRTRDLHPNLLALLEELRAKIGVAHADEVDDPARFLKELASLGESERRLVFRVLAAAAVLDGRIDGAERTLLNEARAASGMTADLADVDAMRRAFVSGGPLREALTRL